MKNILPELWCNYFSLWDTIQNNLQHCITKDFSALHSKTQKIFCIASKNTKYFSALYSKTQQIFPHCTPKHRRFSALHPKTQNIFPHCIPKHHNQNGVSNIKNHKNFSKFSALYPQHGILDDLYPTTKKNNQVVFQNRENYSTLWDTTRKKLVCWISLQIYKKLKYTIDIL